MTARDENRLALPVFPVPEDLGWPGLRVDGLVGNPVTLGSDDLAGLAQHAVTDDFRCEEGWVVRSLEWRGPRLDDALLRAEPLAEARYLALSAGTFSVSLAVDDPRLRAAILALQLNGEPIPREHGGPCRLVIPGATCYYSVKWVDHIRATVEPSESTAKAIALARIGRARDA